MLMTIRIEIKIKTIYHSIKNMSKIRIYLSKYVKELYTENQKTLLRKIKEDMNKCKNILCSWV